MSTIARPSGELTVAVYPGLTPRLIRPLDGVESIEAYRSLNGYAPVADTEDLLTAIADAGVRGRGGAAFPLAIKVGAVRAAVERGRTAVVVANGEEGEPASIKDRWLLRNRPHLVLDGLRLALLATGATRACVYVSDMPAAHAVNAAAKQALAAGLLPVEVEVRTIAPGYVAGEESAVVRAINGGPAKPTEKPPRPFESGVDGHPTLVSNVETLANLPFLQWSGAAQYRSVGTADSPGTFLATVNSTDRAPALYELPHGVPLDELVSLYGAEAANLRGVLMGGYFAGLLNRRALDVTLDHETTRAFGSGLGCGSLNLLGERDCGVAVAASVMAYFSVENAGQCGSCFNGTSAMAAVLEGLRDGVATDEDITRLRRWSHVLRKRGACGTLDGATNLAASVLAEFPDEVAAHLAGGCSICRTTPFRAERPFEVEAVSE